MTDLKWYIYRQNNSGGSFVHDSVKGIGIEVWVEANSAKQADALAEVIGLYFDDDSDCSCCGDRRVSKYSYFWDSDDDEMGSSPVPGTETRGTYLDWKVPAYAHPLVGDFFQCNVKK